MDADAVRKKSGASSGRSSVNNRRPVPRRGQSVKKHDMKEVDKMLLTQSLRKDLNLRD